MTKVYYVSHIDLVAPW